MNHTHEMILCIVNKGYSEAVMDAAREFGARGGTVLNARGTANPEAEKIFNIHIQPEKEMVMILASTEIKDDILHAVYKAVGLNTPGQGIAFSLPVETVVGLAKSKSGVPSKPQAEQKETEAETPAEEKPENNEGNNEGNNE